MNPRVVNLRGVQLYAPKGNVVLSPGGAQALRNVTSCTNQRPTVLTLSTVFLSARFRVETPQLQQQMKEPVNNEEHICRRGSEKVLVSWLFLQLNFSRCFCVNLKAAKGSQFAVLVISPRNFGQNGTAQMVATLGSLWGSPVETIILIRLPANE